MAPATLQAEVTRGLNFYAICSLTVSATGMVPALAGARDWGSVIDDLTLAAIAMSGAAWYVWGQNRIRQSAVPLVLLGLGLVTKLLGAWLAYNGKAAYTGDATSAAFLAATSGVTGWRLVATRRGTLRATPVLSAVGAGVVADDDRLLEILRERGRYGRSPPS